MQARGPVLVAQAAPFFLPGPVVQGAVLENKEADWVADLAVWDLMAPLLFSRPAQRQAVRVLVCSVASMAAAALVATLELTMVAMPVAMAVMAVTNRIP